MTNPWNLTPREADSLDAMLSRGTMKAAARALGIEVPTLDTHLRHARDKMKPPHKLGHFIAWARWKWENQCLNATAKSACHSCTPGTRPAPCGDCSASGSPTTAALCACGGTSLTEGGSGSDGGSEL